jgi:aspartyl-tRNA(Asn)/glutamyl-tRNA(Gln) amidotransferase subunit C
VPHLVAFTPTRTCQLDTALTPDFFARLAQLSRLHLDDRMAAQLGDDLRRTLHSIESLEDCPQETADQTVRGPTGEGSALRDDLPSPCLSVSEALAMAPDRMGDGFAVPQIMAAPGAKAGA